MKEEIVIIENGIVHIPQSVDVWMTQYQLADLFGCFVSKIHANVRAILKTGVLDEADVCRRYHYKDGSFVEQYNPEMITALAFRIKSRNAETFRKHLMKKAVTDTFPKPILMIRGRNNSIFSLN